MLFTVGSYASSATLCSVNFPNAKRNGCGIIAVGNYFQSDVILYWLSYSARWVCICLWCMPMDGWQSTTYLSPPYKSALERTVSRWKAMWSLLPFPVFSIGWNIGVFIDIDMFRKTIKVTSKLHQSSAKNLLLKDFFSFSEANCRASQWVSRSVSQNRLPEVKIATCMLSLTEDSLNHSWGKCAV